MELLELPDSIQIETAMACNLRCPMCPVPESKTTMDGRNPGIMPIARFSSLLNQISDKPRILGLTLMGEPLINKRVATFVRMAKERGHWVALTTNATLLTEETARDLLEAGLDMCKVSFDGTTRETYERIRIGANYDSVIANVRHFSELRKTLGRPCQLHIHCIESDLTRGEIGAFADMWKDIADDTQILGLSDWFGQFEVPPEFGLRPAAVPVTTDENAQPPEGCHFLWQVLSISNNGQVIFCCFDYKLASNLPSLMDKPLIDIWNDEMAIERQKHRENKVDKAPCLTCAHWAKIKSLKNLAATGKSEPPRSGT